ncbi:sensor domain-containing diguanylate cyclase [Desulfoluna spongiiphila]|uniref:sensor domain-containing diguanylate cyclase n=1 Tax=Desulfoluna spongiiphila TaxID=419481 RepID=UPI001256492A|nr:sensor domain-containing diguanylate cyclase [Desulfoluna spongiiphila]VVS92441.1 nucleotide cyclase [Desulfoluna spongiiphila]
MLRGEIPAVVYRNFLLILSGIALVLMGMVTGVYQWEKRELLYRVKVVERHNVDLQREMILRNMEVIRADLLFLARQNELIQLLETHDTGYRSMITEEYVAFSGNRGIYDQVRFIDAAGMEVCRVNYTEGRPVVVPDAALQSKKGQSYVRSSLALNRREVFVSPMDLNMENGEVEEPIKPMIRFGTPVFDLSGGKRGVVVLNYLGSHLLSELEELSKLSRGKILLVNRNGYWLKGLEPDDEWGFMREGRGDRTIVSRFPDTWQALSAAEEYQGMTDLGLFTGTTIRPSGTVSPPSGVAGSCYWKLLSYVPETELLKESRGFLVKLLGMAGVLFLASVLPAFLLAQARIRQAMDRRALIKMANFDTLTGLANRALFLDRLGHTLKRARRYHVRCALLFIDLDGFKSVNDTLGHEAGDEVLVETGARLRQAVRESDMVARHGGDEFTVILPEVREPADAVAVAEKVLAVLSRPFQAAGRERTIGASIGIGVFPEAGTTVDALLNQADSAMYEAKAGGKNRWVLYKPHES